MQLDNYANENIIRARNTALCKTELEVQDQFDFLEPPLPACSSLPKFIRVMGITRFWGEQEILDSASLMGDLISGVHELGIGFVYILKGGPESVELYFGIDGTAMESRQSLLTSLFPAIELRDVEDVTVMLPRNLRDCGIASGVPTNKMEPGKPVRAQIDQLIRGLQGKNFVYMVLASAADPVDIIQNHEQLLQEMSCTYEFQKETINRQIGTGIERQHFTHVKYFENLESMERYYNEGISRGMWYTSIYYGTYGDTPLPYNAAMVGNLIRSTFSGEESRPEPIRALRGFNLQNLMRLMGRLELPGDMIPHLNDHPLGEEAAYMYSTVINSDQLAVLTAMPGKEYPGYYIDDYVEFDSANRTLEKIKEPIRIGSIRQAGRGMLIDENDENYNPYYLEKDDYTRHCLIIGITGGGKTNTSKSLLRTLWRENGIPFLVIESAKREYWELRRIKGFEDLTVYTLGADDERTSVRYRLNPFETFPGIALQTHIDNVLATFKAAFEMYPPMPYVLESAVYEIYADRGWNIITSENDYGLTLYPTIEDLYDKISYVVDNMGYHQEVASNIKSALEARVHSLMIGGKGAMLNTPKSVPIGDLLNTPTVLELEDIGDDETKSFVIGVLMTQLYEYRKASMGTKGGAKKLRHVLMIEEAHRLLKNVQGDGNSSQAKSVEFFCNMLAEIRTYGQAIFIADQVPTKLAPDTLKNTNLKIVHRTVAREDREYVGYAMNMTEQQIDYLSSLRRGYAAVYAEGDNGPKYVKLPYVQDDPELKKMSRTEIIGEIQKRVNAYYTNSGIEAKHCGCTYCELQHRCKHYEEMRKAIGANMKEAINALGVVNYDPKKILKIFRTKRYQNFTFSVWEKNCFLGQILQNCPKIHNGFRKHVLAETLKIMIENEKN